MPQMKPAIRASCCGVAAGDGPVRSRTHASFPPLALLQQLTFPWICDPLAHVTYCHQIAIRREEQVELVRLLVVMSHC